MFKNFYKICVYSLMIFISTSFVGAANIYLTSPTDTLTTNCPNNIDIMIDTQSEEIFWASVHMTYDWKNIEIVWFYLNDQLNLPLEAKIAQDGDLWDIQSAALSLVRNQDFQHIWFTWLVKYATLVVQNKEPITSTEFNFLFSWEGITIDNMDVFRLKDAQDILMSVQWKTFNFTTWECLHTAPAGIDQMADGYDFRAQLNNNMQKIENMQKTYSFKHLFLQYRSYLLMILLILALLWIMYKKWLLADIKFLKHKGNQNA